MSTSDIPGPPHLSILSDQPADEDRLNFAPYAKTLAELIADPHTNTPLTIGVFGGWGQGKTSLMRMVQRRLADTAGSGFAVQAVWFNAWLYHHQPSLWRALISRVLHGVIEFPTLNGEARAQLRKVEARLYGLSAVEGGFLTLPAGALAGLDEAALPPLMGLELLRRQAERAGEEAAVARLKETIADLEASEALTRRDQIAALDDFRRHLEEISRRCVVPHGRLVVFVDDLDRCLPDKAVEVLEAVKLFLDVPGCVFVLGVAREVVEQGIRVRYSGAFGPESPAALDGARYLEKIIQLPFSLPPISPEAVSAYVRRVAGRGLPDARCERVFSVGLEPNPRRIKRTLNIFTLLWRLAQNREELRERIAAVRLAKVVVIQQYHARLFDLIAQGPHYLIDLERRYREQERHARVEGRDLRADAQGMSDARQEPLEADQAAREGGDQASAGPLSEFLGRSLLRALLTCTSEEEEGANFVDLDPAGVREYIYFTRSAVEAAPREKEEAALPFEPQMVRIPAGPFLMGTPQGEVDELLALMQAEYKDTKREQVERETPQHEVTLPAYAISRYPVTNADYGHFIEAGGYTTPEYWTEAGWKRKESEGWTQPRYLEEEQWNGPSQPVVGVSWYEALAYCRWLAAATNKPYRLSSEAEWEKAARGAEGYRYPWGSEWDPACCNNKESGPVRTTPVGQYPGGDSPYGVSEMAGQVWEWCSSKYGGTDSTPTFGYPYDAGDGREDPEGEDTRVQRGGSWGNGAGYCRCGVRGRGDPRGGNNDMGFRCVRTLS